MADFGIGEGAAAAWDAWEAEAAAAAAAEAAAAGAGTGAAATGAASGLTAADLAALSSVGGGSELGGLSAADTGLLGSLPYGAGDTVTGSLTAQPGQGPGLYEELKYKAANALNKAGGMYNKIPGPAQGILLKGLLGSGEQPHPISAAMPRQGMQPVPQSAPTYNAQPYHAASFGSQYGQSPSAGGLGGMQITPEMLAFLKRLQMQQGMS